MSKIRASSTVGRVVSTKGGNQACGEVRLSSYPKIVFFYPTFFTAIVAAGASQFWSEHARFIGIAFMLVFMTNTLVVSFDFPRTAALTYFFLIVTVVFGAILLNSFVYEFIPVLARLTNHLSPEANTQFYGLVAGVLGLTYGAILAADRRFDYWTVESLRIEHHHGPWSDIDQYPAPGSTIQKDITDVFEYLLLRSGRLVIQPPANAPAIVLENVPWIDKKVEQLETLLNVVPVEMAGSDSRHHHVPGLASR